MMFNTKGLILTNRNFLWQGTRYEPAFLEIFSAFDGYTDKPMDSLFTQYPLVCSPCLFGDVIRWTETTS